MLIFPNAAKGIKYVYYSILLMIITLGLSIFTLLFGFFNFEDGNPLLLFVGFFVIAVAILAIVALVLELVGVYFAGKDNQTFMKAFYCIIANLVISIVSSIIGARVFSAIASVANTILNLAFIYFTILGIIELANQLGNSQMADEGQNTTKYYFILFAVSAIFDIVASIFEGIENLNFVSNIFSILSTIAGIIAFVLFFVYIKKAVAMLEGAKKVAAPVEVLQEAQTSDEAQSEEQPAEEEQTSEEAQTSEDVQEAQDDQTNDEQ